LAESQDKMNGNNMALSESDKAIIEQIGYRVGEVIAKRIVQVHRLECQAARYYETQSKSRWRMVLPSIVSGAISAVVVMLIVWFTQIYQTT